MLQLCFYADAIEAAGVREAEHVRIWLGSGRVETIRLARRASPTGAGCSGS